MAWQKITVNVQNVEAETGKAVLIAMRHKPFRAALKPKTFRRPLD